MFSVLKKWLLLNHRELFLHETKLHGANYYETRDLIIRAKLHVGEMVQLRREAQNAHDEFAVAVFSRHGQKLAYLPKAQNHIVACLLDNDEKIIAKISRINLYRHEPIWVKLWLVI